MQIKIINYNFLFSLFKTASSSSTLHNFNFYRQKPFIGFTFPFGHKGRDDIERMTSAPNIHFCAWIHEMTEALSMMMIAISLGRKRFVEGFLLFELFNQLLLRVKCHYLFFVFRLRLILIISKNKDMR